MKKRAEAAIVTSLFRERILLVAKLGRLTEKALAVVQASLALCLILWNASYPFTGELFEARSQLFLAHTLKGSDSLLPYLSEKEAPSIRKKLQRNATRFQALPPMQQAEIQQKEELARRRLSTPFLEKLKKSAALLLFELSPLFRAWLFLSLSISLLFLKGFSGTRGASCFLPLLAFLLLYEGKEEPEESLYPSEAHLFEQVLKEPKNPSREVQLEQIQRGWRLYLLENWSKEGLEEAEFAFNLALLDSPAAPLLPKKPLLLLFFFWNALFALLLCCLGLSARGSSALSFFNFRRPIKR